MNSKAAQPRFAKGIPPADLGAFVRDQIVAQKDQPNPISFTTPDGRKGRVWLASDRRGNKIIRDERHWRVNLDPRDGCPGGLPFGDSVPITELTDDVGRHIIAVEGSAHIPLCSGLKANPPARDPDCVQADIWPRPYGYRVRLCIDAEKELEVLGCGWRIVTVEPDGDKVHLHHNGNTATMKRQELLAANKRVRGALVGRFVDQPEIAASE